MIYIDCNVQVYSGTTYFYTSIKCLDTSKGLGCKQTLSKIPNLSNLTKGKDSQIYAELINLVE